MSTDLVTTAQAALAERLAEVEQWEAFAGVYACATADDEAVGHDAVAAIGGVRKALDGVRREIVEAPKRALAEVDAAFREPDRRLAAAVDAVRRALGAFAAARAEAQRKAAAEQRRREDEERRARALEAPAVSERQEQAPPPPPPPPRVEVVAPPPRVTGAASTGGYRVRRTARIVDPVQVPDTYWRPSLELVQLAVDQGATTIPGVEIVEEHIPTTRRR